MCNNDQKAFVNVFISEVLRFIRTSKTEIALYQCRLRGL